MSNISLKVATEEDIQTIREMQIKAFSDLLDKYQDYDISPAAGRDFFHINSHGGAEPCSFTRFC